MPGKKTVVVCPIQGKGYKTDTFERCPWCGETEGHFGLIQPKKSTSRSRKSRKK